MNTKGQSTLEKFKKILKLRNYSNRSIEIYACYVNEFIHYYNKPALHISGKEIKSYLENYNYSSTSKQNQIYSSIKLFSKHILNIKNLNNIILERPRKNKKLPIVLSQDEIQRMFDVCHNLKHKVILTLLYSTGIRVSELINLKWQHLDRSRGVINIIQGKGKKDRQVMLDESLIPILERYHKIYKPPEYILQGQNGLYSQSSILNVVKDKANKAGITKRVYTHLIRHSCFTHMVENGIDIELIAKLAGHASSKTTLVYCHISDSLINKIQSPIKNINLEKQAA